MEHGAVWPDYTPRDGERELLIISRVEDHEKGRILFSRSEPYGPPGSALWTMDVCVRLAYGVVHACQWSWWPYRCGEAGASAVVTAALCPEDGCAVV
jgi:hypothetical protein